MSQEIISSLKALKLHGMAAKYLEVAAQATRAGRGVDRKAVMSLALGNWIDSGHSVLITGPTGAGTPTI